MEAVEGAFGGDVDYAILIKIYGTAPEAAKGRYSPAVCLGAKKKRIEGTPDPGPYQHVLCGTRQPDDADAHAPLHPADKWIFKKVENHAYAVALHMMYYNFVREH